MPRWVHTGVVKPSGAHPPKGSAASAHDTANTKAHHAFGERGARALGIRPDTRPKPD